MEYIRLLVIIIIITLLWFANYQNHCQNKRIRESTVSIGKLTEQINELTHAVQSKQHKKWGNSFFAPQGMRKPHHVTPDAIW